MAPMHPTMRPLSLTPVLGRSALARALRPVVAAGLALVSLAPDVAAQHFTAPRALPGDTAPQLAQGRQVEGHIAAGATRHLAVWVDGRSGLGDIAATNGYSVWGKEDVFGRFLAADGAPLGQPFLLAKLPFGARRARVAWNGVDQWLVVWEGRRATQTTTTVGIRGVRVHSDGTILDEPPLVIDDTQGTDEMFPDVAGQAGEWMITWNDVDLLTNHQTVSAAIFAADGSLVVKRVLGSAPSGYNPPRYAALSAAGGRYLVAWEHIVAGSNGNGHGRFFDNGLNALGPEFSIGTGGAAGFKADIATNGTNHLVTWNGSRAAVVTPTGAVTPPGGRALAISGSVWTTATPVAWMQDRWVIVSSSIAGQLLVEELDATTATTLTNGVAHDRPGYVNDLSISAIGGRAVATWADDALEHTDQTSTWLEAGVVAGPLVQPGAGAPNQIHPDLDGDPQRGYLVAWRDAISGTPRIMTQRLDADGRALDPAPRVLFEAHHLDLRGGPRVARGVDEYLVVWEGRDTQGGPVIQGKRVAPTGLAIDPAPLTLLPGNTPDVDFEGGVYLVISTYEPTNHVRPVIATRVSPAGVPLDSPYLTVGSSYSRWPHLASAGGQFLGVWTTFLTHDSPYSHIQANFIGTGGGFGNRFSVESAPGSTSGARVAAGANEFLVTFATDGDVWARAVRDDGTLLGSPGGIHLTYAPSAQVGAAAQRHGDGWVSAWTDYRIHPPLEAGIGDVYAARLDSNEALLDLNGLAVAAGSWVEGHPALAGDTTQAVAAFVKWSDSLQALRVHVSSMALDQIGAQLCSPAVPSSSGTYASVHARGSDRAFDNDVTLFLDGGPVGSFGYFLTSEDQAYTVHPGGSQGILCLGGTVARFAGNVFQIDPSGSTSFSPDLTSIPIGPGFPVFPGETWTFQAWFRDANPQVTSNFSDAVEIVFR